MRRVEEEVWFASWYYLAFQGTLIGHGLTSSTIVLHKQTKGGKHILDTQYLRRPGCTVHQPDTNPTVQALTVPRFGVELSLVKRPSSLRLDRPALQPKQDTCEMAKHHVPCRIKRTTVGVSKAFHEKALCQDKYQDRTQMFTFSKSTANLFKLS